MNLTPQQIVTELDKHVVGQSRAKRAVAIALRNRWRRQQVPDPLRHEITPKNILMIGPTGVGKTEIARRLAKLAEAPFIKIEATKFTEVGYVGRDVDTIIRDLTEIGIKQTRELEMIKVRARAEDAAEDRILDILLPPARDFGFASTQATEEEKAGNTTRQTFRKRLREGELNDRDIEIEVAEPRAQMEIMAPPGMEEMTEQIKSMFSGMGAGRKKSRKLKIGEALKLLTEEEAGRMLNEDELRQIAITNVEQNGIVFLDEIDKIASRSGTSGVDVSRAGVQRDLLPRCAMPNRTASCLSTKSTRSAVDRTPTALTCRARAYSVICCRSSKAPQSTPNTAWSKLITSYSSLRGPSIWQNRPI